MEAKRHNRSVGYSHPVKSVDILQTQENQRSKQLAAKPDFPFYLTRQSVILALHPGRRMKKMISTPKTFCPLCGGTTTVLRTINVTRCADQVKYLCKCGCGESEMTVSRGKIISVVLREPEKHPSFRILAG